jgi:hypothetical protein
VGVRGNLDIIDDIVVRHGTSQHGQLTLAEAWRGEDGRDEGKKVRTE